MNVFTKGLLALTVGTTLLAGCAGLPSSSTELTERTAPVTLNSVVFTDYNLSRSWSNGLIGSGETYRLSLVNHGQRPSATGTTEVFVVLRNHTDYDYQVEARTQFFDQDGVPADVAPTWQRLTVSANSVTAYKELSASTQPLQYRVEVREIN